MGMIHYFIIFLFPNNNNLFQVETELDILNQRLDKAEGGRDALLTQVSESELDI